MENREGELQYIAEGCTPQWIDKLLICTCRVEGEKVDHPAVAALALARPNANGAMAQVSCGTMVELRKQLTAPMCHKVPFVLIG